MDYEHVIRDGKDCVLVPVGDWHITLYYYSTFEDVRHDLYNGNIYETVIVKNLGKIQVPWRFLYGAEGILMQGTGILDDGTPIHLNSKEGVWQSTNGYTDYYAGTATFWYGWGGPGYELTPYIHSAVGPSFRGGIFYVPEFAGIINYPGGGYISGVDSGEAIKDTDMDLFVGVGYRAITNAGKEFGFDNPIDHSVPVYQVICQKPGAI